LERIRELTVSADPSLWGSTPWSLRDGYLDWVSKVEGALKEYFMNVPLERLHTSRFWRIHEIDQDSARPYDLVRDEIAIQVEWLTCIGEALRPEQAMGASNATVAVLDTHVLLHFKLFTQILWPKIMNTKPVRIAIPLRVIDELDQKKASNRQDLRERAATALAHLEQAVTVIGRPAPLRDDVTIEVVRPLLLDDVPRRGRPDADGEILDTCESLATFNSNVVLVTGDYGMRLRARDRQIAVFSMPDDLRSPPKGALKKDQ
jgi:rRNA-processing protein FCF1